MCVYYIYSYRDLNLCNYGNWLSILREELIFSYEVGAESLRKGRIQEKMDVKLGRGRTSWNSKPWGGTARISWNPCQSPSSLILMVVFIFNIYFSILDMLVNDTFIIYPMYCLTIKNYIHLETLSTFSSIFLWTQN